MPYSLEYSRSFNTCLKRILKKFPNSERTIRKEIERLGINPDQGDKYPGFGAFAVRKMRIRLPEYGMGKRGGLRLIFLVHPEKGKIVPLILYQKGLFPEQEVRAAIIAALKEIAAEL